MFFHKKHNMNTIEHASAVGFFATFLFIICLLWSVLLTDPAVIAFHTLALKVAVPGFQGFDIASIIWGGLVSFFYGFLASILFHAIHKDCCNIKE